MLLFLLFVLFRYSFVDHTISLWLKLEKQLNFLAEQIFRLSDYVFEDCGIRSSQVRVLLNNFDDCGNRKKLFENFSDHFDACEARKTR